MKKHLTLSLFSYKFTGFMLVGYFYGIGDSGVKFMSVAWPMFNPVESAMRKKGEIIIKKVPNQNLSLAFILKG